MTDDALIARVDELRTAGMPDEKILETITEEALGPEAERGFFGDLAGAAVSAFAAESSAPKCVDITKGAVREMTIDDVKRVWKGGDNSATVFMKSTCGGPLKIAMREVCNETLDSSQVANCYNKFVDVVKDLPVVGEFASKFDIRDYTLQKCEDGLFLLVAEAEKKIRTNAAHRTSDLLHEVFG